MVQDMCSKFIEAATRQFARKGFYGASISSIANELGLSKQAVLHHFGSKEKLYGEVLQQISEPTLIRMFGKQEYRRLEEAYPARLRVLIRTTLATPPSAPS